MLDPSWNSTMHQIAEAEAGRAPARDAGVKMTVYLAARYSRAAELRGCREELRARGHEVTGRWLDGGHEIAREGSAQADDEARARFAAEDWEDLMAADMVISFTEEPRSTNGRGGRHVEFGAALARGKMCVVIGPRENVFHCLESVRAFAVWRDFLDWLTREDVRCE